MGEREINIDGREKHRSVASRMHPDRGMEPATFRCMGQRSRLSSYVARVALIFFQSTSFLPETALNHLNNLCI